MSPQSRRDDAERLHDIAAAAASISAHLQALQEGLAPEQIVMEAIKYNLVAIGEAAAHVSAELRDEHPTIDWAAIKGLRNILTHEYFRVNHRFIRKIADADVPTLAGRVEDVLSTF